MALFGVAGASAPRAQGVDNGFNARISRANKSKELGKYAID